MVQNKKMENHQQLASCESTGSEKLCMMWYKNAYLVGQSGKWVKCELIFWLNFFSVRHWTVTQPFYFWLVPLVVTVSGSPAKDLLYQAANLTRQLLLCYLAILVVIDFLSERLSFSRSHTFLSVLLGSAAEQIFRHWLWFC